MATGPLTADALAARHRARAWAAEHLAYYDAIAPIVDADSIDWDKVFVASRYDKGETPKTGAYVNCPLTRERVPRLRRRGAAPRDKVEPREFEDVRYFEGCLPIEVMAERGELTLALRADEAGGPRRSAHRAPALRRGAAAPGGRGRHRLQHGRLPDAHDVAASKRASSARSPASSSAEFLRFGSVHRNTFVYAPRCSTPTLELRERARAVLRGTDHRRRGLRRERSRRLARGTLRRRAPRRSRARSAAADHGPRRPTHAPRRATRERYQPSNITFSHLPPLGDVRLKKRARYEALAARALADLDAWIASAGIGAAA